MHGDSANHDKQKAGIPVARDVEKTMLDSPV